MASAVKHNIGLDSKACIDSAAKSFLSDMSWHGFTDFKQECVTSWAKLFATNEVQFTDKAIDNFLAFVDHMSCSADTYVSFGGSNGCADMHFSIVSNIFLSAKRITDLIFSIPDL